MAPSRAGEMGGGGSPIEVFLAFLKLGLTSFGGPVAHLGYFRDELVTRRGWLTDEAYSDLVALCQFLPGPASSQVGFALGLMRAGMPGALMAWVAFTLPSALLLFAFAHGAETLLTDPTGQATIHGLKLVAVAVVAHAVRGMATNLCPDRTRATIAGGAVLIVVSVSSAIGQILAIAAGALAGLSFCAHAGATVPGGMRFAVSRRVGAALLAVFVALLVGLPVLADLWENPALHLFEVFYRAGALVFGGGHVVLPLLESRVVATGMIGADEFLAGYGAAQAVPGPLFTFSAYLGSLMGAEWSGMVGALLALLGIFLPGMLVLVGILPFWDQLRGYRAARATIAGTNAAVVGILAAALYHPVWTSAVSAPADFAIALTAFLLLTVWRVSPWIIVVLTVLGALLVAGP